MKGKAFIDTNLLIYLIASDEAKSARISSLLEEPYEFVLSTQVISEFANTCIRKKLLPLADIRRTVDDFLLFFDLLEIGKNTIEKAFDLKDQFHLSWYDALIIAAAVENNCTVLFSEDMHHGLKISPELSICNPFEP